MPTWIWLASWIVAPVSAPDTWAGVTTRIDDCVAAQPIDRAKLAYLVSNELEGAAADAAARLRDEAAVLALACDEGGVVARIEGPSTATTRVDTRGVERAIATRTLALAIVEMVTELPEPAPVVDDPVPPTEPETVPTPKPKPTPKPVVVTVRPSTRWIVRAGIDAIGFPLAPLGLFGGAIDVRHRPSRRAGWLAAVAVHGGRDRDDLGVVRAFAASALLAAVLHGDRERFDPFGAIGVRGGFVGLRGVAGDDDVTGGRLRGAWLGPALRGGVDGYVGRRAVIGAHVEAGWAVLGTRARVDGRAAAGAAALWIGGGLSIGWRVLAPSKR